MNTCFKYLLQTASKAAKNTKVPKIVSDHEIKIIFTILRYSLPYSLMDIKFSFLEAMWCSLQYKRLNAEAAVKNPAVLYC